MSRYWVLGMFLVALVGVTAYHFTAPSEAQRNTSARFEYAVINGSYQPYPADSASSVSGAVNICYLQTVGCQNEELRTEVNFNKFIQDERLENSSEVRRLAQDRAYQTSFSRAITKLGSEGWEMIDAPSIEFDLYHTNPQGVQTVKEGGKTPRQHIWFKRVRQ